MCAHVSTNVSCFMCPSLPSLPLSPARSQNPFLSLPPIVKQFARKKTILIPQFEGTSAWGGAFFALLGENTCGALGKTKVGVPHSSSPPPLPLPLPCPSPFPAPTPHGYALSHAISCLACLYIVTDWALLVFGSRSVPLVIGARTSDLDLPPVPPSRSTRLLT
jgi:hypothetical protein